MCYIEAAVVPISHVSQLLEVCRPTAQNVIVMIVRVPQLVIATTLLATGIAYRHIMITSSRLSHTCDGRNHENTLLYIANPPKGNSSLNFYRYT